MKKQADIEERLNERGIKPTAMRILILRTMLEQPCALSVADLEDVLVTVDKSTIFRTLTMFLQHHLVHAVDDGSGKLKYAVCRNDCHCGEEDCELSDFHIHFYCEHCRHTYCLRSESVPAVDLPEGFVSHSANYVVKGLCPSCSKT